MNSNSSSPLVLPIKLKKLNPEALIPTYAKEGDACLDLYAISVEKDDKDNFIYGTGIALEIPKGYVGLIFPRSSNMKTFVYAPNSVGVIDSGYRGEIKFVYKSRDFNQVDMPYRIGDRVAQIMIIPYPVVELIESEELSDSERGTGGFGHTGN